jgi:hypothetical protein
MIQIPFSYNWNNKLDCLAFSTIRIYNPNIHFTGNRVEPILKGISKGPATIMDVKPFLLEKLSPFIAYLDTGYSVEECRGIILRMYPKIDFKVKQLALILIVKDK